MRPKMGFGINRGVGQLPWPPDHTRSSPHVQRKSLRHGEEFVGAGEAEREGEGVISKSILFLASAAMASGLLQEVFLLLQLLFSFASLPPILGIFGSWCMRLSTGRRLRGARWGHDRGSDDIAMRLLHLGVQ